MPTLICPHPIKSYCTSLAQFAHLNITREPAVRAAIQTLPEHCARQSRGPLVPEYGQARGTNRARHLHPYQPVIFVATTDPYPDGFVSIFNLERPR